MVAAEPTDFVHVYSTKVDYYKHQEIDFFGEISGVALSPDDECMYIGIWEGLMQACYSTIGGTLTDILIPTFDLIPTCGFINIINIKLLIYRAL